jgi:hypothetical protein
MTSGNCPHIRAFRNSTLLEEEGEIVHICPDCKSARLDNSPDWIPARYGMGDYLRSLIPAKKESMTRDEAARTSPDSDPRWSRIQ